MFVYISDFIKNVAHGGPCHGCTVTLWETLHGQCCGCWPRSGIKSCTMKKENDIQLIRYFFHDHAPKNIIKLYKIKIVLMFQILSPVSGQVSGPWISDLCATQIPIVANRACYTSAVTGVCKITLCYLKVCCSTDVWNFCFHRLCFSPFVFITLICVLIYNPQHVNC